MVNSDITSLRFNLATALTSAQEGRADEWILVYLDHPEWANPGLAAHINHQRPLWTGPVEFELERLVPICGPELAVGIRFLEDPAIWNARVDAIAATLSDPSELPPLIVRLVRGVPGVCDGNHRLEAMLRKGWKTGWVFLWIDREDRFVDCWSKIL